VRRFARGRSASPR